MGNHYITTINRTKKFRGP